MKKSSSPVDRAYEFIQAWIRNRVCVPGERLPPVKTLATAARVSQKAICEAIEKFASEGLLHVRRRKGIFFGSENKCSLEETLVRNQKWHKKQKLLVRDILSGIYDFSAPLPNIAILLRKYGVCRSTMKKILYGLENEGIIFQRNRAYYLAKSGVPSWQSTIVHISVGTSANDLIVINDRLLQFVNSAERTCRKFNLRLATLGLSISDHRNFSSFFVGNTDAFGYLIWSNGLPVDTVVNLLVYLRPTKRPVALIDEIGDLTCEHTAVNPFVRIFTIASVKAGRAVARSLLERGHRHIAYLSLSGGASWSRKRLQGICEEFDMAAMTGNVAKFCYREGIDNTMLLPLTPWGGFETTPTELGQMAEDVNELITRNVGDERLQLSLRDLGMALSGIRRFAENRQRLAPMFDAALREKQITAWIADNDELAIIAKLHLREKGIAVPQDLALAGFDNSFDSLRHQLTTYDFAFSDIAHKAISYILNPRHEIFAEPIIECDGYVIERKSTTHATVDNT